MKSIMIAAAFLLGTYAMAEGPATGTKMSKKAAKQECLKENKDLKGSKLAECIKSKTS